MCLQLCMNKKPRATTRGFLIYNNRIIYDDQILPLFSSYNNRIIYDDQLAYGISFLLNALSSMPYAPCHLFRQHQVPPCIELHGFAPGQLIYLTCEQLGVTSCCCHVL